MSLIDDFLASSTNTSSLDSGATVTPAPPYVRQDIGQVATQAQAPGQQPSAADRFHEILSTVLPALASIYAAHKGQLGAFTQPYVETSLALRNQGIREDEARRRVAAEERMVQTAQSLIDYRKALEQHQQHLEEVAAIKEAVSGFAENPAYPGGKVPRKVADNIAVSVPGKGPMKLSDALMQARFPYDQDAFYLKPAKGEQGGKEASEDTYVKRALDIERQRVGHPLSMEETQAMTDKALAAFKKANRDPSNDAMNALLKGQQKTLNDLMIDLRTTQINQAKGTPVLPGSKDYAIAEDLASYKITYQQFREQYAYSRTREQMQNIYYAARKMNPEWTPAGSALAYKFAGNPQNQRTMTNIVNAQAGMDQMLEASEAAERTGIKLLNDKFVIPGGIQFGGKSYSNFATALVAYADELSLALGGGGVGTDMIRQMAQQMVSGGLDAAAFRSQLLEVNDSFLERRRQSFLQGMGPYGNPDLNPGAKPAPPSKTKNPGRINLPPR